LQSQPEPLIDATSQVNPCPFTELVDT
jgi:hypothetical protein